MIPIIQTRHEAIISATCKYYSIDRDELLQKSQKMEVVYHRRICMYLIRKESGLALSSIGERFHMSGENVRICVDTIECQKDVYKWVTNDLINIIKLSEVMAYTMEQLQLLEAAIAQGTKEVQYGDKRVVYRDLQEMETIRDNMRKELGLDKNRGKGIFVSFNKGL